MYLIGITGSIASGKSSVRQILEQEGYETLDADELTHEILEQDDDIWGKLVTEFGDGILEPDGKICRSCLARAVFDDADKKAFLESAIHPKITAAIFKKIAFLHRAGIKDDLIFIKTTLIFQSGFDEHLNEIWLVEADEATQVHRLQDNRNYSPEEAEVRIHAISPLTDPQKDRCEHIDNSNSIQYTKQQVLKLLEHARIHAGIT